MKLIENSKTNPDQPFYIGSLVRHYNGGEHRRVMGYRKCSKTQVRACGRRCGSHGNMVLLRYMDEHRPEQSCIYCEDWQTGRLRLAYKEVKTKVKAVAPGLFTKLLKRKHVHPLLLGKVKKHGTKKRH